MPLIKCPECGKEISNSAKNCPNCGYPLKDNLKIIKWFKDKKNRKKIIIGSLILVVTITASVLCGVLIPKALIGSNTGVTIEFPNNATSYQVDIKYEGPMKEINWGDGITNSLSSHTYARIQKSYNIEIIGDITSFSISSQRTKEYVKNIVLRKTITSIPYGAFSKCIALKNINIPEAVTSIGDDAFEGCRSLTSVNIPSRVDTIGAFAFGGCSLSSLKIENGVKIVGHSAFAANWFKSIFIPSSVSTMHPLVFSNCCNLTDIYCEAENQPVGWYTNWNINCSATVHWGFKA